jgi:hypothetical protein
MLFKRNNRNFLQVQSLLVVELVLVVLVDVLVPKLEMISCSSNSKCCTGCACAAGRS